MDIALGTGFLLLMVLAIGGTIFWIWTLVDCLMKESSHGNDKVIWAIVILLTHLLGALLYFSIRRPQRISELGH